MTTMTEVSRKAKNWTKIETRDQYLEYRDWISKLTKSVDSAISELKGEKEFPKSLQLSVDEVKGMCFSLREEYKYLNGIQDDEVHPSYPPFYDFEADASSSYNALIKFDILKEEKWLLGPVEVHKKDLG